MADEPTPTSPQAPDEPEAAPEPLPAGPLTPEAVAQLIERALAPAVARITDLEENQSGDGAAFPAQYTVTEEGDVEVIESEVVNELVAEEGDLIIGGSGKKARTLKKGKPGQVLTVNPEGVLEWEDPGGGSFTVGTDILGSFFPEDGTSSVKVTGLGFEPSQVFIQPVQNNDPENPMIEQQSWAVTPESDGFEVRSDWPSTTKGIPTSLFFYLAFP